MRGLNGEALLECEIMAMQEARAAALPVKNQTRIWIEFLIGGQNWLGHDCFYAGRLNCSFDPNEPFTRPYSGLRDAVEAIVKMSDFQSAELASGQIRISKRRGRAQCVFTIELTRNIKQISDLFMEEAEADSVIARYRSTLG